MTTTDRPEPTEYDSAEDYYEHMATLGDPDLEAERKTRPQPYNCRWNGSLAVQPKCSFPWSQDRLCDAHKAWIAYLRGADR